MKHGLYLHKQFPWKRFRNYFQTQINNIRPIVLIWRKAIVIRDNHYAEKCLKFPFKNSKFGLSLSCLAYNSFCSSVGSSNPSFTTYLKSSNDIFKINSTCTSVKLQIIDEGISSENVTDFYIMDNGSSASLEQGLLTSLLL